MRPSSFEAFKSDALAEGFDEVLEREWSPAAVVESHTHRFAVWAVVARGEMWLRVGDSERHFLPGDEFRLDRDAPHAERYGERGATLWAARRHR